MDDLPKLWASIKADLHRACNLLPGSSEDILRQYHEFIEHNELESACDARCSTEDAAGRKLGTIRKTAEDGILSVIGLVTSVIALRDGNEQRRAQIGAARRPVADRC